MGGSGSNVVDHKSGLMSLLLRLRNAGISSKSVQQAIEACPREIFSPVQYLGCCYEPRSLPIECGQNMSGPDPVAAIVDRLNITPLHSILEIGTGSGYQAAVMANLGKKVLTIERYRTLCEAATQRFESIGIANVTVRHADGQNGVPGQGLYDRIVANVAFGSPPKQFLDQLASGGMMIAAIGPGDGEQMLTRLIKVGSRFDHEDLFKVRFQPFEPGVAQAI